MFVYLVILSSIWMAWLIVRYDKRYIHIVSLGIMALAIFFAIFRYDVGMDYTEYKNIFQNINYGHEEDTEFGFALLCLLIGKIGGSFQLMFAIVGIVISLLFYKSYKRLSSDIVVSLSIFILFGQMYLNTFNALRQCVAAAIFSYSIRYIVDKNLIKYLLFIFIASCFHTTALLLLPLYWILPVKWGWLVKLIFLFVITIVLPSTLLMIISESDYAVYLKFEQYSQDTSFINYLYLIMGAIILLWGNKLLGKCAYKNILLNINYIAFIFFVLYFVFSGTPMVMVITRLNYYFIFFYAIIIAWIISSIPFPKFRFYCELGLFAILTLLFIRTTLIYGEQYTLLPYRFNFQLF